MGLSVSSGSLNVLVACYSTSSLVEYTRHGGRVRVIVLPDPLSNPLHAVALSDGHIAVVCGPWSTPSSLYVIDRDGVVVTERSRALFSSAALAVDAEDRILACDRDQHRVLVIDAALQRTRVIPLAAPYGGLQDPWTLCLDRCAGRLYVGEWSGGRVLAFDDVLKC